jgi:hypothetical protein
VGNIAILVGFAAQPTLALKPQVFMIKPLRRRSPDLFGRVLFLTWGRFEAFFPTVVQITFGNDAAVYGLAEFGLCRVFSERSTELIRQRGEAWQGNLQVTNSDNRLRLVSDSKAHLRSIIATLDENRAALVESSNLEAAQILAIVILQLRMQLHGIDSSDLKAFCQVLQLHDAERVRVTDCCR